MSAQWVGPTATAPGSNASAPINLSANYQAKLGDLGAVRMRAGEYCDAAGLNCSISLQQRITSSCPVGQSIRTINADGTVVCQDSSGGTGSLTFGGSYALTSASCSSANPATGACSCPTGFTSRTLSSSLSTVTCTKTGDSDPICNPAPRVTIVYCYK